VLRLDDYITALSPVPFVWGANDCVLFATNWYKICTKRDVLAGIPQWGSEFEAARRLASLGGLEVAALKVFGPSIMKAQDGDIAYVKSPHNCLGIVKLPNIVLVAPYGLTLVDIHMGKHFWKTE